MVSKEQNTAEKEHNMIMIDHCYYKNYITIKLLDNRHEGTEYNRTGN